MNTSNLLLSQKNLSSRFQSQPMSADARALFFVMGDALVLTVLSFLMPLMGVPSGIRFPLIWCFGLSLILWLSVAHAGLYHKHLEGHIFAESRIWSRLWGLVLIMSSLLALGKGLFSGGIWLIGFIHIAFIALLVWRFGGYAYLRSKQKWPEQETLLLGEGEPFRTLWRFRHHLKGQHLKVTQKSDFSDYHTLDLSLFETVLWVGNSDDSSTSSQALETLQAQDAHIQFIPDLPQPTPCSAVNSLLMTRAHPQLFFAARHLKRSLDMLGASLGILALSPLLLSIYLAIKWDSKGPALYKQQRVTEGGRVFRMWKFRTMNVDAEQRKGPQWAEQNDQRVTRVGRFLRRSSLDELPQLFNVLKGDMSLIGPRPERPCFVVQFSEEMPHYAYRHLVKSGLTGWAQIHGWRGNTSLEKRIEYDLYYIAHWSLFLDIRIVFQSVFTVVSDYIHQRAY